MVSEGWEKRTLASLADYHNGRAFKPHDWEKEGLPIIRIAQMTNPIAATDFYSGDDIEAKHKINNGDMLFSWSATLAVMLWNRGPAVLNQHIFKVEEKPGIYRYFLYHLLNNSIDALAEHSHGSTMKHIKKGVLKDFIVSVPSLPEQKKIAVILNSVDDAIQVTQAVIDQTRRVKQGLLQQLLTRGIGHTRFKQTEIGEIPETWEVKKLSDLVNPNRPITYGIVQTGPPVDDGIPCVRVVDLVKRRICIKELITTTPEINSSYKRTVLQKNDIMFALRGEIGHVVIVNNSLVGANLTRGVALISPRNTVFPEYLLWVIRSPIVRNEILIRVNGSALREIPLGELKQAKVPVPPINEQHQIVEQLSSIDNTLVAGEDYLHELYEIKRGLMQDLLTGRVRVKLYGDATL